MSPDTQWPSEDEEFDAVTKHVAREEERRAEKEETTEEKPITKVSVANADEETRQEESPEASSGESEEQNPPGASEEPEAEPEAAPEPPQELTSQKEEVGRMHDFASFTSAPKASRNIVRLVVEAALVLALIGVGLWGIGLNNDNKDLKTQVKELNNNPQIAVQKQTNELIAKVGSLIDLPKNETPTVANVSDAAAAKKQSAFFNNALNGDKVLMYAKAGEAILYRPSTNKIVLVAPLTFTDNAASTAKPAASSTTTRPTTTR